MKTVTMKLENANAELRVGDSNGVVIINNNNLVSIEELKEILSMFNYLNNSTADTKINVINVRNSKDVMQDSTGKEELIVNVIVLVYLMNLVSSLKGQKIGFD